MNGRSLLLIEDSPTDALMVEAALEDHWGEALDLVRARTLAEGLAALTISEPACLLVDLGLPDSDGLETLDAVVQAAPEAAVVVLTGRNDDTTGQAAVRRGAQDYLVKGRTAPEMLVRSVVYATERKRAEIARRRSEARARALIERSTDVTLVIDGRGRILFASPSGARKLGYEPDAVAGCLLLDFVHPEDREQASATIIGLTAGAPHNPPTTFRLSDGAGEWRWIEAVATNLIEEPAVAGIVINGRDVTARHAAEEALARQADHLARSNAELERFAYVASHDLSEPLRTVAGFVDLLALRYRGTLDAEADEFIDFTLDGVRRMQSRIQSLLAYAMIRPAAALGGPIDVGATVDEISAELDAAGCVHHGALPAVVADPEQLRLLLRHLLTNALTFLPPGREPSVTVAAERQPGFWRCSVTDNGIGIAPRHQEQIFRLFQRLHSQDDYPGTGIGLAVCQRIVEGLGGEIWVESAGAPGSTFHFTLPQLQDAP
jgi:PAS domain S-box-containing protein